MPPARSTIPPAAKPVLGAHFDTWNSSATGHQRAENRMSGSIGWRQKRSNKLTAQFRGDNRGATAVSDEVDDGCNSEKANDSIAKDDRNRTMVTTDNMPLSHGRPGYKATFLLGEVAKDISQKLYVSSKRYVEDQVLGLKPLSSEKGIFDGLVIYINGSTHPLISDHRLKHILAENGARVSMHLGRRQITHVILGRPCSKENETAFKISKPGAGGGLAATKIQTEIRRVGGCGIKYVGVEWVLESIKAGRRLRETRFSNLKIAAKGQQSVYNMFKPAEN